MFAILMITQNNCSFTSSGRPLYDLHMLQLIMSQFGVMIRICPLSYGTFEPY